MLTIDVEKSLGWFAKNIRYDMGFFFNQSPFVWMDEFLPTQNGPMFCSLGTAGLLLHNSGPTGPTQTQNG